MVKDDQVLIRLNSTQKEKWQDHVEEEDKYRDLTNLIEFAVEDRISEDKDEYNLEEAVLSLTEDLQTIQGEIADLKELNEKIENTKSTSLEVEQHIDRLENVIKTRLD